MKALALFYGDDRCDSRFQPIFRATEEIQPNPELTEEGEEIKEDLDRLLDEIDEILEEDSEEFVENYIQRGGQ